MKILDVWPASVRKERPFTVEIEGKEHDGIFIQEGLEDDNECNERIDWIDTDPNISAEEEESLRDTILNDFVIGV